MTNGTATNGAMTPGTLMSGTGTSPTATPSPQSLYLLGYSAAVLPLLTMHLCFLVSAWQGHIDWCMPYWSHCVSISRAGRYGLSYFLFKGGFIPTTILLGFFWQLSVLWLQLLTGRRDRWLPWIGWLASLSLLVYTLALGHHGDAFRQLRRAGVILFMGLTFIAQVRVSSALAQSRSLQRAGRRLLAFCGFILAIALVSLGLDAAMGSDYDMIEDTFEWWLVMLLIVHFFALARLWQRSGFRLQPAVSPGGG
ncbi:hypothetical protein FKG94_07360 [Exilibacterium tricleocarpae]|uniref:CWH43-like N-terminal domain-containing protein n=1 Tax=Exilibacterium tricleocarpae TaxID=2591008 RepID=A0A545TZD0_9GAMM|nr:hypothetical protein [Exilibacterium tricleocarpae]TQV82543.1 hypothetical protein FKG94_07360 [Exilibacterium tricleocarpae]